MSHDIVKENDNFRVYLEADDSGEKPYDEGAVPILSREFRGYGARWEAVNDAAEEYSGLLNALQERFNDEEIERFIRIFLGAYSVKWDSSDNCRYLAFDTTAWRGHVGLTDEWLARPESDPSDLAAGSLSEVISWANGDVYGYVLERRVVTHTVVKDATTGEVIREDDDEFVWEVIDSCWGFYGYQYATEAAEEVFESYTK
jgi:hypothetical protein